MPGELIAADGQFQLEDELWGEGTQRVNRPGSPKGLGVSRKTTDVDLAHADGSYMGPDFVASKVVTFDVRIITDSGETAMESALALVDAFTPDGDTELWGQLPGLGLWYIEGRPAGAEWVPVTLDERLGHVEMSLTFIGADGAIHLVDES